MTRTGFVIFACLVSLNLSAQVVIQYIPALYGRTVDGMFSARFTNTYGEPKTVQLMMSIDDEKSGRVCTIRIASIRLLQGNNTISGGSAKSAVIQFSESPVASLAKQTGYLPGSSYTYCFELTDTKSGEVLGEQCFDADIQATANFSLISPYDYETVCDARPMFNWQPLVPAIPGIYYQLMLCEVKQKQSGIEALNFNLPLVNQTGIGMPLLVYPSNVLPLVKGTKYAWQVIAYRDKVILQRSDVWEFEYKCQDSTPPIPDYGYRSIEDLAKGNFYIAKGSIRFSLHNPYGKQPLYYDITDLAQPDNRIRHLPKLQVQTGTNNILIDISDNRSFADGNFYQLNIKMPNGISKKLRFQYKQLQL